MDRFAEEQEDSIDKSLEREEIETGENKKEQEMLEKIEEYEHKLHETQDDLERDFDIEIEQVPKTSKASRKGSDFSEYSRVDHQRSVIVEEDDDDLVHHRGAYK
jgi:succinate dehydrogenase/fumarate reductase flavoprotein subunit